MTLSTFLSEEESITEASVGVTDVCSVFFFSEDVSKSDKDLEVDSVLSEAALIPFVFSEAIVPSAIVKWEGGIT